MFRRLWILLRAVLAAVGALVLLVSFTPLAPWAGAKLSGPWTGADHGVLIVLGGGTVTYSAPEPVQLPDEGSYWRAIHATAVWRNGHFRTLVLCGAHSAESLKPLLVAGGIPESAIVVEERSTTTRENVLFSKPILNSLPGPFVLLTSDYHTWRASRCFAKENIRVETLPAPDLLKRSAHWMARWQCFQELCLEGSKIVYYRFKGWI